MIEIHVRGSLLETAFCCLFSCYFPVTFRLIAGEALPLSPEYLRKVHADILADSRFRAVQDSIALIHTAEEIDAVLRKLSGLD